MTSLVIMRLLAISVILKSSVSYILGLFTSLPGLTFSTQLVNLAKGFPAKRRQMVKVSQSA